MLVNITPTKRYGDLDLHYIDQGEIGIPAIDNAGDDTNGSGSGPGVHFKIPNDVGVRR
ncbi:MAG: hypothetical protein KAH57_11930 [Thermoplasmata archaeon]|nr:hypothetical protein [Thermoplasmata archaeon]